MLKLLKKSNFSEDQISNILKEYESGKLQKTSVENMGFLPLPSINGKYIIVEKNLDSGSEKTSVTRFFIKKQDT
ncbi:hypothetical protein EG346_15180 [Chryseobacterium carnipullorum]|uniref:Uncharacterized protein n=1 Tax=Chryseobacterium carnipullorum TaxID=1124835 RepID=A0A3G6M1F2_CHRCU|nr:hypothetical protein EG346_15180 [Chryseobacterium carnipullorum]AZA64331.1 hypothetical protein EG345_06135 [Chryseobacterium carnipullorum]